ncbi:MAG: hypothetical protein ACLGIZ_10400 [Acidimicrobiia bacterium]
MSIHRPTRPLRAASLVLGALLLAGCGTSAAGPSATAAPPAVDPASADVEPGPHPGSAAGRHADGPYQVSIAVDLGPLPDGSGDTIIETTWTVDAAGTRELVVDTPAGHAARHVFTDDEHWWWVHPSAREELVDAEWIHFDLRQIEAAGGDVPEVVAEGRVPIPDPGEIVVGQIVAGHEVLAVDDVGDDEAHLTVAGIERPMVHRRRPLPPTTTIDIPDGAVDVADLPGVLRW